MYLTDILIASEKNVGQNQFLYKFQFDCDSWHRIPGRCIKAIFRLGGATFHMTNDKVITPFCSPIANDYAILFTQFYEGSWVCDQ